MFKLQVLLILCRFLHVNNLYIPDASNVGKAEEVQNAICSITTKEIEATANATITRQLKGVCTSNELNLKMDKLQSKILQEIDSIRYMLETNGFKSEQNDLVSDVKNNETVPPVLILNETPKRSRIDEILMYNDTLTDTSEGNKYFYYWQIHNALELLAKNNMYKSSPDFYVLGHTLHLQFYPKYLGTNFALLLKPESAGFLKRHQISILNQLEPGSDLLSGLLYGVKNDERIFTVPEDRLRVEGFVIDNTLIVKLEIFLDL